VNRKFLSKNELVDGAYYEGKNGDDVPCVAWWNAKKEHFTTEYHTWEDVYLIEMGYPGSEPFDKKYVTVFYPIIRAEKYRI